MGRETELATRLVTVVKESLSEGKCVDLDGLGIFIPDRERGFRFIPEAVSRVFVAHVEEDTPNALRLADALSDAGMKVWIDKWRLQPGQDWKHAIERAIERADFFIPCFSRVALRKRGQFPAELRQALRCAEQMPLEDLFIIPVRFEDCRVPITIQSALQYVDLFPEWTSGVARVIRSVDGEAASRRIREAA